MFQCCEQSLRSVLHCGSIYRERGGEVGGEGRRGEGRGGEERGGEGRGGEGRGGEGRGGEVRWTRNVQL